MQIRSIQNIVGLPSGRKEIIKEFQSTDDIINAVLEQHELNKPAFKKFAKHFDSKDVYTVCRKLWEFVHYNLNYKAEPNTQSVKSVSKMLMDANTGKGNDCKHFSGFIAGCLDALNIPFVYRFAAYDGKIPTHVYVVAKHGEDIICDAVLPYFDSEKTPTYKIDINPKKKNNMPLIRMTGFPATIGYTAKEIAAHKIAVAAAAVPRGAFLSLVALNVHGLATKMKQAIAKDSKKVEAFWYKFGGDFSKLKQTVEKGATKKRILGVQTGIDQSNNTISPDYAQYPQVGSLAAITAFLTSAAPIIIPLIGLLKSMSVPTNDVSADATNFSGSTEKELATADTNTSTGTGISTNTMLLVGGAALVAFLIFKKK